MLATLLSILLGGWFLFVAITAYAPLVSRPVALPEAGKADLLLDDFIVFYTAGKHAPTAPADLYEPKRITVLEAQETGQDADRVLILPFFNPPATLLPLFLLGLLPLGIAAVIWLISGMVVGATALHRLTPLRQIATEGKALLFLGIVASLPFYQAIVHGQMTFLLLGGFGLYGIGILQPKRESWAVVGLLLLAFKPIFLLFPLLYLALQGRYRTILTFVGLEIVLIFLAAALFEPQLPVHYVTMSLQALGWDEVNGISTLGMFGWNGFWRGIVGPDARELQIALTTVSSLTTAAGFCWVFRHAEHQRLALSAVVISSLLVSPHSYAQDLLLLTMPLLLFLEEPGLKKAAILMAIGAWFTAYFHFATLDATGVGVANLGLIFLASVVLHRARKPSWAVARLRPGTGQRLRRLETSLSSADAAGS